MTALPQPARALRRILRSVALSAVFVLAALLYTFPLQRVIAYPFVFLFFAAVIASAWFGGLVAGALAVCFSSLLVTYFFVPPANSFTVAKESRTFLAAYILCAIAVAVVSFARRRAESAVLRARDELEARVRERTAQLEQSNRDIRERERQLRALTEAIPQQIWRASADGRVDYLNQHLRDYLGPAADDPLSALHRDDAPLVHQAWSASLASGSPFEIEARVRSASGDFRWFLLRSLPQRDAAGEIVRWYGIHIDIDAQRRAQQSLVRAQDDLARLSRTLSLAEMAAAIAHQLNQPLTAVVTHAHACRKWLAAQPPNLVKATATAEKIVRESTRASDVVQRVRALFGRGDEVRQPADLNALLRELARLLRDEAIRRGVTLRLDLSPALPRVSVDPVQIQQVLLNLAANGMDAMAGSPAPRLLILRTALEASGRVRVAVEDTGPGLAPDAAAHIFEPFFTTKPQGIGMGLAICRSIVEAHDSRLLAANRSPSGACFQFSLRALSGQ